MLGVLGQHGDEWAHVLARKPNPPMDRLIERAPPRAWYANRVAEEDHINASALGDARDLLEQLHVGEVPAGPGSRQPPAALEMGPRQVEGEVHLLFHGPNPSILWRQGRAGRLRVTGRPAS